MAVEYKGGKCSLCGYDKSYAALQFHHRNPKEKSFSISNPKTRSWEKIKIELDKCDILCSNCHAETENAPYEFKYRLIKNGLSLNNGNAKDVAKKREKRSCIDCSRKLNGDSKRCKKCHLSIIHLERPNKEWLSQLVYMIPMTKIGEIYGVTDNCIRKWCHFYDISVPKFGAGYWLKIK